MFILGKKAIVLLALLFLIGAIFYLKPAFLFKGQSLEYSFKTATVQNGDLLATINASGQIEAENQAAIKFLTSGRVVKVYVKEGVMVRQGDVLASLDVQEAEYALAKAEASLRSAQSAVDKVLDDIRLFRHTNDNNGETQTQKNAREEAEAARDAAYQDVLKYKKAFSLYTINAPFDGTVIQIADMEEGQNITTASASSITVMGDGELRFAANIDETDFRHLTLGQKGKITLDAFPGTEFEGEITKIAVAAQKLTTGGAVIPIQLSFANTEDFKSGLNGEVDFEEATGAQ